MARRHRDGPAGAPPSARRLREARLLAHLDLEAVRAWTGRHRTTVRRQERGQARVDPALVHLLEILAGALPWDGWEGWRVARGRLYAPEDPYRGWTPADIRRVHWTLAAAAEARATARRGATHASE